MESKTVFADIKDVVAREVGDAVDAHLKQKYYNATDVQGWTNAITSEILLKLKEASPNFKYIVTCTIMQKSDGGVHVETSCYWNASTDGNCAMKWENETMYCVINVFAVAI